MTLTLLRSKAGDDGFRRRSASRWRKPDVADSRGDREQDLPFPYASTTNFHDPTVDLKRDFRESVRNGLGGGLSCINVADMADNLYTGELPPHETLTAWGNMAMDYGTDRTIVSQEIVGPAIRAALTHVNATYRGRFLEGLDYGTGPGKNLPQLMEGLDRVYGVDVSSEMIHQAKGNLGRMGVDPAKVHLSVIDSVDALRENFPHKKFPFIFVGSVLMVLNSYSDVRDVLQSLNLLLEPNLGRLLVTVTNTNSLGTLPYVDCRNFGLSSDQFLYKELIPLLRALEKFRVTGEHMDPDSEAYKQLQIYGSSLCVGEWGSFTMEDRHEFGFVDSTIVSPRPKQTGEPYVVLGRWSPDGPISIFRDRFFLLGV